MIKNYFITALRNILRRKVSSSINIFGLATGIATAIIILLWVDYNIGFDKCFENHKVLYRVYHEYIYTTGNTYSDMTSTALGPTLTKQIPEIVNFTRTSSRNWIIGTETKRLPQVGTPVDSSFFSMFSLKFVKGNPQEAFSDSRNIILSESSAKKLFGDTEPINQIVRIEDWYDAKVTGIFKDIPKETHFWSNFEFFVPFEIFEEIYDWNLNGWENQSFLTYIQLNSDRTDIHTLKEKIEDVKKQYDPNSNTLIRLRPITEIHTHDLEGGGLINYIYILSGVAIFIILIACINYLNLSTALSITRSREIGLRKVIGADRQKLITQFLTESVILSIIAVVFALILALFFLPYVNNVLDTEIRLNVTPVFIISILMFTLVIGVLAGFYPAIIQSSFNTIICLKGSFITKRGQLTIRKILVVFQFLLSVLVIIVTLSISRQINFILDKDLGYNKENVISFDISSSIGQNINAIFTELRASPYVLGVCASNTTLDSWTSSANGTDVSWKEQTEGQSISKLAVMGISFDFDKIYKLDMVDGRFFSRDFSTDMEDGCVVNETAVREMEMENPIGKTITVWDEEYRIVGVVKDFHYSSLHTQIKPLIMAYGWALGKINVRIHAEQQNKALVFIEDLLKKITPNEPFTYEFLDQNINELYAEEYKISTIMSISSVLAILISCMGLFGLSFFVVERRIKEIGIRKVNGATVSQIAGLFVFDFLKLVMIAIILAYPLAYYFVVNWLNNFAYKNNLSWKTFLLAGSIVAVIAIFTVSYQVVKASLRNPVELLKFE